MDDSYSGPATVLLASDVEIPVTARLRIDRSGNLPGWHGSLSSDHDLYPLFEASGGRLQLPDGKVGDILPSRMDGADTTRMSIKGSGAPPF
ncbi:hypothetical protein [Phytohabitans houttuyneae]|uniref:DUF4873 domain-containing protein n=1 Tax=Phytohabitans houttuyneae TaxID=1076126 RepID=A0A6V8K7E8_9ACTN|nr:hypothetical protein [Phytohabitans houttuyneae]GFJ79450.1 hypothetical protein Phou_036300 [Phytohabitans houttuyneae]